MSKSEKREIVNITRYISAGMVDTAARAASALYRAASNRSAYAILCFAISNNLETNPNWITK